MAFSHCFCIAARSNKPTNTFAVVTVLILQLGPPCKQNTIRHRQPSCNHYKCLFLISLISITHSPAMIIKLPHLLYPTKLFPLLFCFLIFLTSQEQAYRLNGTYIHTNAYHRQKILFVIQSYKMYVRWHSPINETNFVE